jgi:hypothetical protein
MIARMKMNCDLESAKHRSPGEFNRTCGGVIAPAPASMSQFNLVQPSVV